MDPTALPTDNLYKFLALAGLMLAGFCAWLIWKIREAHASELAGITEEITQLNAHSETIRTSLVVLKNDAQHFHAGATDTASEETNRFYADLMKGLSEKVDRIADEQNAVAVKTAVAQARKEAVETRRLRHSWVVRLLICAVPVGMLISVLGFACWYRNVQWYTDKQTKADFEDHMAELAVKRAARAKVKP